MTKLILPLLLLFSSLFARAQDNAQFAFNENEAIKALKQQSVHKHLRQVTVYDIKYLSADGTLIKGFAILPNNSARKYPVILFNRGGNGSFGMVTNGYIVTFLSKIAARGYIIIGSNLRGSEGSEDVDEFGGKSVEDVMQLFTLIDSLKIADTSKIAQIGWSRGGITNFGLLKKTGRIKTTINIAGQADILDTDRGIMYTVYRNRIRGYVNDSISASRNISPIYQMDSIVNKKASILFVHGENDERVNVAQSRALYEKSRLLAIKSVLLIYPDGSHSLREHFPDLVEKIDAWLKEEL